MCQVRVCGEGPLAEGDRGESGRITPSCHSGSKAVLAKCWIHRSTWNVIARSSYLALFNDYDIIERPSFQTGFTEEVVGLTMCRQATFTSARNCSPNEVLSIGTNMFQGVFERMAKVTTVTAPSTMKIKVVAPPDGTIFTVGAKRND